MVTSGQRNIFYHTIAIITVVIWGTTFVSTKILINIGLSPAEIMLYRFVLAYFCMLPFLSETLTWVSLTGALAIIGGVYIAEKQKMIKDEE